MGSFTHFLFHGFGALIRFGGVSVVLFLSLLFVLLRGVVYMMGALMMGRGVAAVIVRA